MALFIRCPICGPRNGYEFRYGGEDRGPRPEGRDGTPLTPRQWCEWTHLNTCAAGVVTEWWLHQSGCGIWFKIQRDTVVNRQVEVSGPAPLHEQPVT